MSSSVFDIFKPADFYVLGFSTHLTEMIARTANGRFYDIAREWQQVWICAGHLKTVHLAEPSGATHVALLAFPRPIEKEKPRCNHDRIAAAGGGFECAGCGAKLKATFEEVKE